MDEKELNEERSLLSALERRNIKAFIRLYKNYSEDLLIFAYTHLNDKRLAIRTVDEFFEDLWLGARFTEINPPIYRYLLKQIRFVCEQKMLS